MIQSWWAAHALELVVWGAIVVLLWIVWLGSALSSAWQERKQKRKDGLL